MSGSITPGKQLSNQRYHASGSLILTCCMLLSGFFSYSTAPQSTTSVRIIPGSTTLTIGETTHLDLKVESVTNLYGFELHLTFNPAVIQVVDANPAVVGVQIQSGDMYQLNQGFLVINQVDNQNGQIVFAFTLLSPSPPITGDGTLVGFDIQGIANGNSTIDLEQVILASPDGQSLPFEGTGGVVNISPQGWSPTPGSVTETPYASPVPTQMPEPTQSPVVIPTHPSLVTQTIPSTTTPTPQTNTVQGATPDNTTNSTPGNAVIPLMKPSATTEISPTPGKTQSATTMIEATPDTPDTGSDSRLYTGLILPVIGLIIFLICGIIIMRRISLRSQRKSADKLEKDDKKD